jgi:predicted transposase YdaD
MSGHHDLGNKDLFSHRELVRDLLVGFTDLPCLREIEVTAFERVNATYVSEHFAERHGDMVWKLRLGSDCVFVYLLLEFQSQSDRWMALRMQVYIGLLYQDLVKRAELAEGSRLPAVLPVVPLQRQIAMERQRRIRCPNCACPGRAGWLPGEPALFVNRPTARQPGAAREGEECPGSSVPD